MTSSAIFLEPTHSPTGVLRILLLRSAGSSSRPTSWCDRCTPRNIRRAKPCFLRWDRFSLAHPFTGSSSGNALMLFTICLMLFAWVSSQWALAVSAMFGLILSPTMYWTTSYWGGSVAASGGALVLLAIGLYLKRPTPHAGVVFALGALLLFWTRPYEGGVFTLLMLMVFAARSVAQTPRQGARGGCRRSCDRRGLDVLRQLRSDRESASLAVYSAPAPIRCGSSILVPTLAPRAHLHPPAALCHARRT